MQVHAFACISMHMHAYACMCMHTLEFACICMHVQAARPERCSRCSHSTICFGNLVFCKFPKPWAKGPYHGGGYNPQPWIICIYIYMCPYICSIFVNGIRGASRCPDDSDLVRFSGPIKIAQTLGRECFWSFLDVQTRSILESQNRFIFIYIYDTLPIMCGLSLFTNT